MTAWVYSVMRNEAALITYWTRHYATFCERMIVYDDRSDDGTPDLARAGGAEVREYPGSGLDDQAFVDLANAQYKEARGHADWVVWVDGDEFLYHPRMQARLDELFFWGVTLPLVHGYNMVGDRPPTGPGQIYDEIRTGFGHERYSKRCILRPDLDVVWEVGKHDATFSGIIRENADDPLKLLHYRYLGAEYHRQRSAHHYARLSEANKRNRFGYEVTPGWNGEYSTAWYEQQRSLAQVCV